jgi:hypothetical protein
MLGKPRTNRNGWLVTAGAGLLLFLAGCDPTLQATIENGIITTSQSLFASVLRALINVAQEANTSL